MWNRLVLTGWLVIGSVMDIKSRVIPVWMLALGGVLCIPAVVSGQGDYIAVLKGGLPGALLLLMAIGTKKAGYGDGIALFCTGMALGGGKSMQLFGISLFLLSLCALVLLTFRKVRRDTGMPYLPFLTAAWFVVIVTEKL